MSERGTGIPRGTLVYTENNYMPEEYNLWKKQQLWWLQLAFYKINSPLLAKLDNIFKVPFELAVARD